MTGSPAFLAPARPSARRLVGASLAIALLVAAPGALASTITVNSTADTVADDGACTLREAIVAANTNAASGVTVGECDAGQAAPTADTIAFAIAGSGVRTIGPTSALPAITEAVVIDGYTQRPCASNPEPCSRANTKAIGDDAELLIETARTPDRRTRSCSRAAARRSAGS